MIDAWNLHAFRRWSVNISLHVHIIYICPLHYTMCAIFFLPSISIISGLLAIEDVECERNDDRQVIWSWAVGWVFNFSITGHQIMSYYHWHIHLPFLSFFWWIKLYLDNRLTFSYRKANFRLIPAVITKGWDTWIGAVQLRPCMHAFVLAFYSIRSNIYICAHAHLLIFHRKCITTRKCAYESDAWKSIILTESPIQMKRTRNYGMESNK